MEVGSCHRLRYRQPDRQTDRYLEMLDKWKSVAVTYSGRDTQTDRQTDRYLEMLDKWKSVTVTDSGRDTQTDRHTDTLRYWTCRSR